MGTTLISTVYSIEPIMICITRLSPSKIILIREDNAPEEKLDVENVLMKTIGKFIELTVEETALYDTVKVAKDTRDLIEDEHSNGNRVIVNVSGGRKPQALGALFGCYSRHQFVDRIVYVTEEEGDIIDLPILNFGISKTKKEVLEILSKNELTVKDLADEIGISRGMTYNHIRELREMGFIYHDKLRITSAGKLAII